jgi:hypothetical protein
MKCLSTIFQLGDEMSVDGTPFGDEISFDDFTLIGDEMSVDDFSIGR